MRLDSPSWSFAILLLTLAGPLAAQDGRPRSRPDGPASLLGLARDARWEYRVVTTRDGERSELQRTVLDWGGIPQPDGTEVHQLFVRQGEASHWEYRSETRSGLRQHHNSYLGGMRGFSSRQKPRRLLPLPLGIETEWSWHEQMSVQLIAASQPSRNGRASLRSARPEPLGRDE